MFILGLIIVLFSITSGYYFSGGDFILLWQPSELLIIIGGGIGAAFISSPPEKIKQTLSSLKYLFKVRPYNKEDYTDLLRTYFLIFRLMRSKGLAEIESHIENPKSSEIFSQSKLMINNEDLLDFTRDNLRLIVSGINDVHQLEVSMNSEIDIYETYRFAPSKNFLTIGDSLPALGIVAAVLGVILTMKSISQPPEVLGSMIAAALVGTFSGVLFSYGLCNPVGYFLQKYALSQIQILEVIKTGILCYAEGQAPSSIVEFMRKNISPEYKPNFYQVDKVINNK